MGWCACARPCLCVRCVSVGWGCCCVTSVRTSKGSCSSWGSRTARTVGLLEAAGVRGSVQCHSGA